MKRILYATILLLSFFSNAQSSINKSNTTSIAPGGGSTGGGSTTATGSSTETGVTAGNLSVSLSGAATYSIPISVPPGINGVVPQIGLSYNSQSGVGIAGYGWNISGLSAITRIPSTKFHDGLDNPVDFDIYDRYALDGQRLILKSGTYGVLGSTYVTENYSNIKVTLTSMHSFSYYMVSGIQTQIARKAIFKVEYPDGSMAIYGDTLSSTTDTTFPLSYWENPQGVRISYNYTVTNNSLYLSSVKYGSIGANTPINEIQFIYKNRTRNEDVYVGGINVINDKILSQINVKGNGVGLRNYFLAHDIVVGYERMISITEKNGDNSKSHNPTVFDYGENISDTSVVNFIKTNLTQPNTLPQNGFGGLSGLLTTGDFDGDGDTDFINGTSLFTKVYDDNSVAVVDVISNTNATGISTVKCLDANNKLMSRDAWCIRSETTNWANCNVTMNFNIFSKTNSTITNEYSKQIIINSTKYYTQSGDFNGDGLTDQIIVKSKDCTTNNIEIYFINLDRRISTNYVNLCGTIPVLFDDQNKLYFADFNGDGKTDILVPKSDRLVVYTLDNNNNLIILWETLITIHLSETTVAAGNCHYYDYPVYVFGTDPPQYQNESQLTCDTAGRSYTYPICIGDYNGDGKADIMLPGVDRALLMSTGISFINETFPANFPSAHDLSGLANIDFNGDGKTDVLFITPGTNTSFSINTFVRNSAGIWANSSFTNGYYDPNYPTATAIVIPFMVKRSKTYNGKPQLVCIEKSYIGSPTNYDNNKIGFCTNLNSLSFPLKSMKNITLGNGVKETITYSSLTDGNGTYMTAGSIEQYPNVDIINQPGLNVVSQIERISSAVYKKQLYKYYGATNNLEGLGFLGFRSVLKTNWFADASQIISNVTNYSVSKLDALHNFSFRGAPIENYSVLGLTTLGLPFDMNNPFINWSQYTYNYDDVLDDITNPLSSNKVFKLKKTSSITIDGVQGNVLNISTKFDLYNNPITKTTIQTNDSSVESLTTVENLSYDNLPSAVPYFIGRPTNKVVTKTIQPSNDTSIDEELYTYSNNLLTQVQKRSTNSGVITDYVTEVNAYDAYGNIITKTLKATNETDRVFSFQYDSTTHRFLTKRTDIQGLVTDYSYDLSTGLLSTESPPFTVGYPLTTTYTYDTWGKKISTKNYLNKVETYSYAHTTDGVGLIVTTNGPTGEDSSNLIILDDLGRKIHEGTKTIDGNWSYTSTYYDINDQPILVSQPYFAGVDGLGTFDVWNEMQFDVYGRLIQSTSLSTNDVVGKQTSYSYSGLSATENDGQKVKVTIKNPYGKVISVTETPTGISPTTINYEYFANGNLKKTSTSGVDTTIQQDGWGRKITLNDPSAGIYKYTYNNFGEIKTEEVVAKGITTYTLDIYGKITAEAKIGTGSDSTNTLTSYAFDPTSKLLTGMTFVDNTNNYTINYSYGYDNYRRLNFSKESRTGLYEFQKDYTFDAFGRPEKEHFLATDKTTNKASDKWIKTIFKNGYKYQLYDMTSSTVVGTTKLWQTTTVNQQGNILTASFGNGVTISETYDIYGFPSKIKHDKSTTNIMTLNTTFESINGNLTGRDSNLFGTGTSLWSETFNYDNFDRLTSYKDTNGIQTQAYNTNGTISNNNIGNYAYNLNSKPYTVSTITPVDQSATSPVLNYYVNRQQNITYNFFKSPVTITEASKENIDFEYNAQERRSVMYYGDQTTTKSARMMRKFYSSDGSMEIKRNITNSVNDFVTYIGGDGYTAPVVYKSDGTTVNYFYLHRDYQGSILAITNSAGVVIEKRLFDVWGSLIKYAGSNGVSVAPPTTTTGLFLDRGYTGHEHLLGVGLINMNGRIYDNKLHRFLQPDNSLQDPSNSQNYNRYGYGLNNPTKYIDPTGNDVIYYGVPWGQSEYSNTSIMLISLFANSFMNSFYTPPYSTEIKDDRYFSPLPTMPSWVAYASSAMYINTSFGSISLSFSGESLMSFNGISSIFSYKNNMEGHSYVADNDYMGGNGYSDALIKKTIEETPYLKQQYQRILEKNPGYKITYKDIEHGKYGTDLAVSYKLNSVKSDFHGEYTEVYKEQKNFDGRNFIPSDDLRRIILHEFGHVWSSLTNVRSSNFAKYDVQTAEALDEIYADRYAKYWSNGLWPLNSQSYETNRDFLMLTNYGKNALYNLSKNY